jgi:hypothetical protein
MLWCGSLRRAAMQQATTLRAMREVSERVDVDFPASCNDLSIAVCAARELGALPNDMHAFVFDNDVLPRDFSGATHHATPADIDRVTQRLSYTVKPEDVVLFVASNHGLPEGLLTSAQDVDEFEENSDLLTPAHLDHFLARLACRQIVVIAACHGGSFLSLGTKPERVVLTACAHDEPYFLGIEEEDIPHSPFLRLLLCAWTGAIAPFGSHVPLPRRLIGNAFEYTKQELFALGRQCPQMNGALTDV